MPVALSGMVGPQACGLFGIEQEARDAAERKADAVIGRPAAVGPGGAEAGDRAVNELGIRRGERVGAEARAGP